MFIADTHVHCAHVHRGHSRPVRTPTCSTHTTSSVQSDPGHRLPQTPIVDRPAAAAASIAAAAAAAAMAATSSTVLQHRIEPLKGSEQYYAWRIQMLDILTDRDLETYPLGLLTPPNDKAELAAWQSKDRKALSAIRLAVAPALVTHIGSCTTSKGAWDTLQNIFNSSGPMARVTVSRKLQTHSIMEGADMEAEIRQMQALKEQLGLMGHTVSDGDFAYQILHALPLSWDSFISSFPSGTLSSADVVGRLLQEDSRRKDRSPGAFLASRPPRAPTLVVFNDEDEEEDTYTL